MQVNILDAKNRLSHLVKVAQCGEEVVIANRGQPVARLVGILPPPQQPDDQPRNVCAWLDRRPVPRHARRSASEIDADLARERSAWD